MPLLGPRRLKLVLLGLGAAGTVAAGGLWYAQGPLVASVMGGISAVASLWVPELWKDRPRPRWLVLGVDLPLVWWWAALVLLVPLGTPLIAYYVGWKGHPLSALPPWTMAVHVLALALAAWGVLVERHWIRESELGLAIDELPTEFDGYRVVHLSDLHITGFTPLATALGWVPRVAASAPDLVVITGDLSSRSLYRLGDVRAFAEALWAACPAVDGVLVSLGNHERNQAEAVTEVLGEVGFRVLRSSWYSVTRGPSQIHWVGLDDWQRDPETIERLLLARPGAGPVMLLAHSPALARRANRLRAAAVLIGHTHGGQIGVPLLGDWINLATLTGQGRRGLRLRGRTWEHVSAGVGTSGPPLRLGVRPEIVTLVLRSPRATIGSV